MEEEEGARVLGVGVGLFLIILIWSLALAGVLLLTRTTAGNTIAIISIASISTIVLIIIPRQEKHVEIEDEVIEPDFPTDSMFIWRTIMVILSCLFSIVGVILVGLDYGMHSIKPAQIKKTL